MANTNTQLRGHCQCCGRVQAVVGGRMSKHGYTVQFGWFSGVCSGQHLQPLQVSREYTDNVIAQIRADVPNLLAKAAAYRAGTDHPEQIKSGRQIRDNGKFVAEMIAFADASAYQQKTAIESAAWDLQRRAEMGQRFANELEATANAIHGTALIEVERKAPAARVEAGDRRISGSGKVITAKYQDGARVYYQYTRDDGKTFTGWTGVQAWRKLAAA